jgi:hypothetical protein
MEAMEWRPALAHIVDNVPMKTSILSVTPIAPLIRQSVDRADASGKFSPIFYYSLITLYLKVCSDKNILIVFRQIATCVVRA